MTKSAKVLSVVGGLSLLSDEDFDELSGFCEDTLELLVNAPDLLTVKVSYEESAAGQPVDSILVALSAPRSEIAMIVGRGAETARALHRVFLSVARRMGWKGELRLDWQPVELHVAEALKVAA
jgi:predicted RNA-binding protein YlqC (UPF0109 family)